MAKMLAKPAAAEVRLMLQKIKLDNMRASKSFQAPTKEPFPAFNYQPIGGGVCGGTQFLHPEVLGVRSTPFFNKITVKTLEEPSPWPMTGEPISEFEMGSFTSQSKVIPAEDADKDVVYEEGRVDLKRFLDMCQKHLVGMPEPLPRTWKRTGDKNDLNKFKDSIDFDKFDVDAVVGGENIRVLQWNVLSQTLGTKNDNFVRCPESALNWSTRRYRMLEEIARHDADVICLQEVDHFQFLKNSLSSLNYDGHFFPKPDSPCLYLPENAGPDGCAIFYKKDKFDLQKIHSKVIEVCTVQSNQVVLSAILRSKQTKEEICVAATHLKARTGALLSILRNEQGKFLLQYLTAEAQGRPVIITGDFNAEPTEPVYSTMTTGSTDLRLASAYAAMNGAEEPEYTSWKIREDGEHIQTLDYMFYSSDRLQVQGVLDFPEGQHIGQNRLPSNAYASDHCSLVTDFKLCPNGRTVEPISSHFKPEV